MTTASIQLVRRRGLLLGLLLIMLCAPASSRPLPSFAQSGCASSTAAALITPSANLTPRRTISLRYKAGLGGDTLAVASLNGGQTMLLSRGADLGAYLPASSGFVQLHLDSRIEDIAVGADALYLANGAGGFQIASRDATQQLGTLHTTGMAAAVALDGTRAYLAAAGADGGLQIVDVSNSASPQLLGSAVAYGSAEDVALTNGLAYVAEGLGGGIEIFDVSNPSAPGLRGSLITPGTAHGVAVSAGRAYVAGGVCGLQMLDITNSASPRLLGAVATGGEAQAVRIAHGRAYVATGASGLHVFDLSGDTPQLIASRSFGDTAPISDVFLDSDSEIATLAAGSAGAISVDISNTALATVAQAPTLGGVRVAHATGDEIYLALGTGGVAAIDSALSDTLIPSPRQESAIALSLAVGPTSGGKTTLYTAGGTAGLGVIQATPGDDLTLLRSITLPGTINAMLVDDSQAYVAAGSAGVHILSLADPLNPALQTTIDTPTAALGLALDGKLLYVADRAGLQIIDLATDTIIGSYNAPTGAFVQGVVTADGQAYLADRSGLIVLDVSTPASPTVLSDASGFSAYDLALHEGTLFVAAGKDGVLAFELSDPAEPQLAGRYDSPGSAVGVTLDNDTLLVADGDGGVLRLEVLEMPYQVWVAMIEQ
ncbi:MAG: hypothetical protein HGA19_01510 [Oscillochloris sp.]|nr:hypothetical protein [Oscillochloris sp.]